ncbi:MAG: TonB family protein, partial [Acidobacteria bacterium]|nr:TonB family protein [Acidobacteriota bacterium]
TAGRIVVAVEYNANGKIGFIAVLESLPNGLDDEVIKAVERTKFKPATQNGNAVTTIGFSEHSFTIY